MILTHGKLQKLLMVENYAEPEGLANSPNQEEIRLYRWLVSFSSGRDWYPVGQYAALDATSAIERAVEVFGEAAAYQAEEIPWDAAPLVRLKAPARESASGE
jgi:hypothetical protein